jgi:hypothetical protein
MPIMGANGTEILCVATAIHQSERSNQSFLCFQLDEPRKIKVFRGQFLHREFAPRVEVCP